MRMLGPTPTYVQMFSADLVQPYMHRCKHVVKTVIDAPWGTCPALAEEHFVTMVWDPG